MKQRIVLIASILVGLLAFWLTGDHLQRERARLYAGAAKVEILAAARDLPAGTVLKVEDLGKKSVYKTAVGENVFRPADVNTVLDKKVLFSLKSGEPLWWSHVQLPDRARGGLAPTVRPGLRALSLNVGGAAAVSGLVQPNDRVDIIGTFTFPSRKQAGQVEAVTLTLLQDVSVLATGQRLGKSDLMSGDAWAQNAGGYSTVTLEVSPREAEVLTFAQHVKGQLTLALRNPEDVSFERDLPEIDFQHLENRLPELNTYRQKSIRNKTDL